MLIKKTFRRCWQKNITVLVVSFFLCCIAITSFSTETDAREPSSFSFGVQAGLHNAYMLGLDSQGDDTYRMRRNPVLGIFSDYNFRFSPLRIKTEVSYTRKGAIFESSAGDPESAYFSYLLDYIEVPLLLIYTPPVEFWQDADLVLFAGPYAGYNINAQARHNDLSHELPEGFNEVDYGATIGIAADGRNRGVPIKLEGRYTHGFNSVFNNSDLTNISWSVALGYYLAL